MNKNKEAMCPKCGSADMTRVQRKATINGKQGMYWIVSCDGCGYRVEISEVI